MLVKGQGMGVLLDQSLQRTKGQRIMEKKTKVFSKAKLFLFIDWIHFNFYYHFIYYFVCKHMPL